MKCYHNILVAIFINRIKVKACCSSYFLLFTLNTSLCKTNLKIKILEHLFIRCTCCAKIVAHFLSFCTFLKHQTMVQCIKILVYIERVLCETFVGTVIYPPKMGIVEARKLRVKSKIFMFSKTVHNYGNRSADICLGMQAVGQAGHSLLM